MCVAAWPGLPPTDSLSRPVFSLLSNRSRLRGSSAGRSASPHDMARILADGSVNRKGRTYFLFVLATESGVFAIPFWYALRLHNVNFDPDNSEFHALSCYFPFETVCYLIIASAIVGACLGFLNTEIIVHTHTHTHTFSLTWCHFRSPV